MTDYDITPEIFNEWDYFDQRLRLRNQKADYVPHVKTSQNIEDQEDNSPIPLHQRPSLLTFIHNIQFNFTYIDPPDYNDEMIPMNYVVVSILFIFIID